MARREIGSDLWIKADTLKAGETVFKNAQYLGEDEGRYGTYHRFFEDGNTYCMGGGDLKRLCSKLVEGDNIELEFEGEKEVPKGDYAGKMYHSYKMWIVDPESEATEAEAEDESPARAVSKTTKSKTKTKARKRPAKVDPEDSLDGLDDLE
jgi:hypothetical protein